jgi:hypothetical protein
MLPVADWALLNPGTGPHAPILQLLGDASGNQSPSLLETVAADDQVVVAPAIPLDEAAAGTDVLAAVAAVPLAETAAGSDSLAVAAAFTVADDGAAADLLSVNTGSVVADAFQAPQWLPGMFVSPRLAAPQGLGDSATGLLILSDTASADDSAAVAPAVPLSETAAGSDSLSVAAVFAVAETAAADDAVAVTVAAPLVEAGSAADVLAVVTVGAPDSIQFVPSLPVDPPPLQLLGDTAITSAQVNLSDTASADDVLSVNAAGAVGLAETAVAADSLSVAVSVPLAELVSAAEATAFAVVLSLTETPAALDNLFIGGSGIQGQGHGHGPHSTPGNVYPRTSAGIIGSVR